MFNKKTVKDIDVKGKRVLVRVDFNVPMQAGEISDDTRILAALPTIKYLLDQEAIVILCSHLGRPKGQSNLEYSLRPVSDYLAGLIEAPVHFAEDCVGEVAEKAVASLMQGEVLVLENTRFHPGEKQNDPALAALLAGLAEVYVNDAFGSAHRAHASTSGVAKYLPSVAGLLMQKEIQYLGEAIANPAKPLVAILGGAKISDKIGVIHNLLEKADAILIGGGMANTFFQAQGLGVGDSLVEAKALEMAKELLALPNRKFHFPVDMVVADEFAPDANHLTMPKDNVPVGWRILDIGPETIQT
ncbi:MAG: phosphoglycerate kinase, partial [Chloroflexota bacterium]